MEYKVTATGCACQQVRHFYNGGIIKCFQAIVAPSLSFIFFYSLLLSGHCLIENKCHLTWSRQQKTCQSSHFPKDKTLLSEYLLKVLWLECIHKSTTKTHSEIKNIFITVVNHWNKRKKVRVKNCNRTETRHSFETFHFNNVYLINYLQIQASLYTCPNEIPAYTCSI